MSHDMLPLNENIGNAVYSRTLLEKKKIIDDILYFASFGTYVVGGDRGAGKTSVINKSIIDHEKRERVGEKRKYRFRKVNIVDSETDLLSELIIFCDELSKEKSEKLEELDGLKEKIEEAKHNILFEIQEEQIREKERVTSASIGTDAEIKGRLNLGIFRSSVKANAKAEGSFKGQNIDRLIKSPKQRREEIVQQLLEILNTLSKEFVLVIIIDELDKMKQGEFKDFFVKYKVIFTESNAIYFLLTNHEEYVDLLYSKDYVVIKNIVRDYIFLPRLVWSEFIAVAPKILKFLELPAMLMLYYRTKGNYREIVKEARYYDKYNYKRRLTRTEVFKDEDIVWSFIDFCQCKYIEELPEELREITIDLLFDIFMILQLNGEITEEEIEYEKEKYLSSNTVVNSVVEHIVSMIKDSKELLKKNPGKKRRKSIKEELQFYYGTGRGSMGSGKDYKIEFYGSSELNHLKEHVWAYYECLDGVIIVKEELPPSINHITYKAIILVSGETIESKAFVFERGFAWNHERASNVDELIEYLNDEDIEFILRVLPKNKILEESENIIVKWIDDLIDKLRRESH